jgi:hypothetical protein
MNFAYEIERLWERPADLFLNGALGTLPFAVLGALPESVPTVDALASVAQRLIERIERETSADQGPKPLTAAFLLAGLRVSRVLAQQAFRGVRMMRDSDTYMAILDEGREEQIKADILLIAMERFGPAKEPRLAQLNGITDLERLRRLLSRTLKSTDWQDLLDTP